MVMSVPAAVLMIMTLIVVVAMLSDRNPAVGCTWIGR